MNKIYFLILFIIIQSYSFKYKDKITVSSLITTFTNDSTMSGLQFSTNETKNKELIIKPYSRLFIHFGKEFNFQEYLDLLDTHEIIIEDQDGNLIDYRFSYGGKLFEEKLHRKIYQYKKKNSFVNALIDLKNGILIEFNDYLAANASEDFNVTKLLDASFKLMIIDKKEQVQRYRKILNFREPLNPNAYYFFAVTLVPNGSDIPESIERKVGYDPDSYSILSHRIQWEISQTFSNIGKSPVMFPFTIRVECDINHPFYRNAKIFGGLNSYLAVMLRRLGHSSGAQRYFYHAYNLPVVAINSEIPEDIYKVIEGFLYDEISDDTSIIDEKEHKKLSENLNNDTNSINTNKYKGIYWLTGNRVSPPTAWDGSIGPKLGPPIPEEPVYPNKKYSIEEVVKLNKLRIGSALAYGGGMNILSKNIIAPVVNHEVGHTWGLGHKAGGSMGGGAVQDGNAFSAWGWRRILQYFFTVKGTKGVLKKYQSTEESYYWSSKNITNIIILSGTVKAGENKTFSIQTNLKRRVLSIYPFGSVNEYLGLGEKPLDGDSGKSLGEELIKTSSLKQTNYPALLFFFEPDQTKEYNVYINIRNSIIRDKFNLGVYNLETKPLGIGPIKNFYINNKKYPRNAINVTETFFFNLSRLEIKTINTVDDTINRYLIAKIKFKKGLSYPIFVTYLNKLKNNRSSFSEFRAIEIH